MNRESKRDSGRENKKYGKSKTPAAANRGEAARLGLHAWIGIAIHKRGGEEEGRGALLLG